MAKALFISRTDLVKNSVIDGNTDTDSFIQFIKIAQEIHIQNYLGTKLYNRISSDIIADTLTGIVTGKRIRIGVSINNRVFY